MHIATTAILVVGGPSFLCYQLGCYFAKAGLKSDETEEVWNGFKQDVRKALWMLVVGGHGKRGASDTRPED